MIAPQKIGRPLADETPASGHIHLRVTMERKNRYDRAARRKKQKLSAWMTETLDRESGEVQ
jgi:predicted HicB family RNase H-like nuclease